MDEIKYFEYFHLPPASYDLQTKNILQIPTNSNIIPCLFVPMQEETTSPNPKNPICLYFHGNFEDIGHTLSFLRDVQKFVKIDFLSIEYPGYGVYNCGKSTLKMKADSLEVYDYLIKELHFDPNNILTMGRSLGSGPAIYIASHRRVAGVIVMSGYSSMEKFLNEAFKEKIGEFKFKNDDEDFNNLKEMENIKDPLCWIHGKKDKLIRLEHVLKVEEKMKNKEDFYFNFSETMTHN